MGGFFLGRGIIVNKSGVKKKRQIAAILFGWGDGLDDAEDTGGVESGGDG